MLGCDDGVPCPTVLYFADGAREVRDVRQGYAGHSAKLCNEYVAKSRKKAFMIFGGASLVGILLIAVWIGATGNAKEAGPSAAARSAVALRPGIVLRPRHP